MFGGVPSKFKVEESPRDQQQHQLPSAVVPGSSTWKNAVPVAFYAQYNQHGPPSRAKLRVAAWPAAWPAAAAQQEGWQREMMAPPSLAKGARRKAPTGAAAASAAIGEPTYRPPPHFIHAHDKANTAQQHQEILLTEGKTNANAKNKSVNNSRKAGQMGTGALSNTVGVWTSSGIAVSKSRASKVDESVDVGAQANPSGVYPVMRPMAYLSRHHRPPSPPPGCAFRGGSSDLQRQNKTAGAADITTTNLMPLRAHPFGTTGMMPHPDGRLYSRPFSAPASMFSDSVMAPLSSPARGGAFKHPVPPSPGVGLRRTSNASGRGKGASAGAGLGISKAAARAAARAAAAASVISAVADSRKIEARAAAAAAAAAAGGSPQLGLKTW